MVQDSHEWIYLRDTILKLDARLDHIEAEINRQVLEFQLSVDEYIHMHAQNQELLRELIFNAYWFFERIPETWFYDLASKFYNPVPTDLFTDTVDLYCEDCGTETPIKIKNRSELYNDVLALCPDCMNDRDESSQDRLHQLKNMPYKQYLLTDHWKQTRTNALKVAEYKCQLCNKNSRLQVHHRTYENRGDEKPSDLIVLCSSCHAKFHNKLKG